MQNAGMTVHDLLRPGSLNNLATGNKDALLAVVRAREKRRADSRVEAVQIRRAEKPGRGGRERGFARFNGIDLRGWRKRAAISI